jgi:hypothetical protein
LPNILDKSPYFRAKQTQSCPPPADSKPFIWQTLTQNIALRQHPKAKPNKPNQTQSKANSWTKNGPQSQNEPNQTQSCPPPADAKKTRKNQRKPFFHEGLWK